MTTRSILIATAAAIFAITLPATAAHAAATKVGNALDPYELAIDGPTLYWNNDRGVTKVDIATGASTVVFYAPRGSQVYDMEAGGGTLAILVRKFAKHKSVTKAYVRSDTTGVLRVAAKGTAKYKKTDPVCGTEVQLGKVADSGEALVVRNKYSLSKKICKKPENLESDVIAAGPAASRVVFTGRFAPNNPLVKLGIVFDADMAGDKLMLSGFAIGVLDLATRSFAVVANEPRNAVDFGQLDRFGNPLITRLKGSKGIATTELLSAESGYSAVTPIESGTRGAYYETCGDYLMRSKFDLGKNQTSSVTVTPNPLAPPGLTGSTALAEGVNQPLWASACDGTNVAYAVSPVGGSNSPALFVAPLAG
jgi:hypothetical protein